MVLLVQGNNMPLLHIQNTGEELIGTVYESSQLTTDEWWGMSCPGQVFDTWTSCKMVADFMSRAAHNLPR